MSYSGFAILSNHRVNFKENEKWDLKLAREIKKKKKHGI